MKNYRTIYQTNNGVARFIVYVSVLFIIFSFHIVSAAAINLDEPAHLTAKNCGDKLGIVCPDSVEDSKKAILTSLARRVNTLIYFVGTIVVLALIYGAIRYISSAGDEAEAKKAKQIIIYAIIGLLIIGVSGTAINAYINTLSGVPIAIDKSFLV